MDPFQQIHFAEALRTGEAPDFLVAETAPADANQLGSLFSRYFLRVLSEQHGISLSNVVVDAEGRVWARMVTADQPYWLSLRSLPAVDPLTGLLIASGIALLSALAGGIALQSRIAFPLKRLEEAVGRLSSPTDVYDLDIDRPREIVAVSRALANMSTRLQAAEADRALMLAGVSHDLRTPLTKLRLTLAMLKDADAELVKTAERNVIRIETMLRQFLDFARGFEEEETRSVPLRPLFQQAKEACGMPETVVLEVPTDIVVGVKEAAVLRALENLLSNALRYGKPPIEIVAGIENDNLIIEVRDAGEGMTADDVPVLMRPFARGNSARNGEGAGLGLAIVDQVARAHGGIVEFEEKPQHFVVRMCLPQDNL